MSKKNKTPKFLVGDEVWLTNTDTWRYERCMIEKVLEGGRFLVRSSLANFQRFEAWPTHLFEKESDAAFWLLTLAIQRRNELRKVYRRALQIEGRI